MRGIMLICLVLHSAVLFAQTDTVKIDRLAEVVVIAQRNAQPQHTIPYSVNKTDSVQLHYIHARTTPESLQNMPGIFIQKTNHGGGSAFIRGLTGNQVLLLMDGIRLNNATYRYGPNQYLNTIDPYIIQSIEVAKGTGGVQYGTDAIGGVINLLSRDLTFSNTKRKWNGKGIVKWMSHGMEKTLRSTIDHSAKRLAFTAGITLRDFGDLLGGDTTDFQRPSGYKQWSLNAKAKFQVRPSIHLTLSHQQLQQEHVPVYHKVKLENFFNK